MKQALVAILLAVAPTLVQAQDWTWQNPLPQGNALTAVNFIDPNNGWAVGAAGSVVHTSDGGATWALQGTGTARDLVDVDVVDGQRGWAAGAGTYDGVVRPGPLLATSDGGQTWSVQTTSDFGFRAVGFGDASTGCALSDRILCTSDGGATWTDRGGRTAPEYLEDIQWLDAQNGWILVRLADGGLLLRTSDGGQNWSEVQTGSAQPLHALHFVSTLTGWVVGDNSTVLRTDDGGTTWATQFDFRSPTGTPLVVSAATFQDVQFTTANDGWLVPARSNFIFRTSDGGTTWTQSFTGASWIEAVALVGATTGWAVGEAGEIVRSTDGGVTWTQQTPGRRDHFQAVSIIDEDLAISGWVPGRIAPGKTSEGASWGPNSIIMTAWGNFQVNEDTDALCSYLVWYVASMPDFNSNLTEIMAVCGGPYVQAAKLLHGSGAGLGKTARADSVEIEWTLHQTGETGEIHGATIVDPDHWWVVGADGLIRATADAGATWTDQDPGIDIPYPSFLFRRVFFADLNTGWIVGDGGTILHTTDGGQTWAPQVSGTTSTLRDVYFLDAQRGFVTGPSTAILATTDGGTTWTPRPFGGFGDIHDLTFADDLNGWGVGQNGLMVRTTDGGLTWSRYPSPTTNTLFGVAFVSPNRGWAVGAFGTILFFGDGAPIAAEPAPVLPDGFALLQNYPNPFNPRTTIRFRLDRAGPVRLQVFDVLGRLVRTLVDGDYAAGEHAVEWVPQNDASGVYFYRLESGGLTEVRKMTLLR